MMSSSYKAAVIQMNSQTDLDENLEKAFNLIKEASENGALVAGLPENFAFLGGLSMRMERADEIAERIPQFLSKTAKDFGLYIMGGSYPVPTKEGKVYNHSTIYGPDGMKRSSYNKIHLFDVDLSEEESYRESDYVKAGKVEPVIYEDETIGDWGLSVCYDLRFPELYRILADRAQVLSVPSAFTYTTGQDHWKVLLKARAIENTSYIFAPAQTGTHGPNRKTWGHAMIIDPWGDIIANAGKEPGVAYGEIEPSKMKIVREKIPSLQHRRFQL
ncbi:carbon-nitrogen hydrolase family protein [Fodinibius saliphilus]|uniref:carbon-nitrogen hydrolase family protein n=1 Tax=Fodinibius saliphilus TaxID=1920650 RepID=UPI001BB1E5C2|nr:carbon-nitrogen hydrolase family protein [Fodinibius saliphilus]